VSRPFDPRLLREARGARTAVAAAVLLGLATTALVLLQATLLARVLARALLEADAGLADLGPELVALGLVIAARAAVSWAQAQVQARCAPTSSPSCGAASCSTRRRSDPHGWPASAAVS
jgi:hypothetical protein